MQLTDKPIQPNSVAREIIPIPGSGANIVRARIRDIIMRYLSESVGVLRGLSGVSTKKLLALISDLHPVSNIVLIGKHGFSDITEAIYWNSNTNYESTKWLRIFFPEQWKHLWSHQKHECFKLNSEIAGIMSILQNRGSFEIEDFPYLTLLSTLYRWCETPQATSILADVLILINSNITKWKINLSKNIAIKKIENDDAGTINPYAHIFDGVTLETLQTNMRATGLDLTPLTAIALKNLQSPYIPRERADSPETVRSIFTPLFLPRNIRAIYAQLLQQDDMEEGEEDEEYMDDTYDEDFEENETPSIYNLIMTLEAIAAGTLMECALGITHDTDTKKMRQYILKTLSNTDIDSSQLSALSTVVHDISDEQRASPQLQKVVNQINYQHYNLFCRGETLRKKRDKLSLTMTQILEKYILLKQSPEYVKELDTPQDRISSELAILEIDIQNLYEKIDRINEKIEAIEEKLEVNENSDIGGFMRFTSPPLEEDGCDNWGENSEFSLVTHEGDDINDWSDNSEARTSEEHLPTLDIHDRTIATPSLGIDEYAILRSDADDYGSNYLYYLLALTERRELSMGIQVELDKIYYGDLIFDEVLLDIHTLLGASQQITGKYSEDAARHNIRYGRSLRWRQQGKIWCERYANLLEKNYHQLDAPSWGPIKEMMIRIIGVINDFHKIVHTAVISVKEHKNHRFHILYWLSSLADAIREIGINNTDTAIKHTTKDLRSTLDTAKMNIFSGIEWEK